MLVRKTDVPYVLIDGSLKDSPTQVTPNGALLGVAEKAETLALIAEQYLLVMRPCLLLL